MKRSKRVLVVCNCHLNGNSIVPPLADYGGVNRRIMDKYWQDGTGILQLPCPETAYLGLQRWGMTKNQYDTPSFRRHCCTILKTSLDQIVAYTSAGYDIVGILGVDGSPSCGIDTTCVGYTGGEIDSCNLALQKKQLVKVRGAGVFIEVLQQMLVEYQLKIPFLASSNVAD